MIGGHFVDQMAEKIKTGSTFRGTGIMWDLRVWHGQMQKDNQNLDLHLYATNLIENRDSLAFDRHVSPIFLQQESYRTS